MPKVKELGVTVVPQQFAPNEIGGGAACARTFGCTDCTTQQFSICGTSPGPCTDCTRISFQCAVTHTMCTAPFSMCSDCTTQAFSICGTTPGPCGGCTKAITCTDCTNVPFSICGTTPGPGTEQFVACRLQSRFPTILDITTPCGGSFVGPDTIRRIGGLRAEDITQLKTALQAQIQALEEAEKSLGPKTVEEIDAREKQLSDEMGKLKSLRTELSKKK